MKIDLDDAQLRTVVSAAIIETLTPEKREALFQQAIEGLFTTTEEGYGSNKRRVSKIGQAFDFAIDQVAREVCAELIRSEPYANQLREVLADAMVQALETRREAVVESMGNAFSSAIIKGMAREY